eukprot:1137007-Pelagomonas_calceolata.AAC.3
MRELYRCAQALNQLNWIGSIPHSFSTLHEEVEDLTLSMDFKNPKSIFECSYPPHVVTTVVENEAHHHDDLIISRRCLLNQKHALCFKRFTHSITDGLSLHYMSGCSVHGLTQGLGNRWKRHSGSLLTDARKLVESCDIEHHPPGCWLDLLPLGVRLEKKKEESTPAKRPRAFRKGSLTSGLARVSPKGP